MSSDFFVRNIKRKTFAKIPDIVSIPSLIEVQKKSYEDFLQINALHDTRKNKGLQSVFKSIFPINDFSGTCTLDFGGYRFDKPRYDVSESKQRGISYVSSLRVILKLVLWDIDPDTGAKEVSGIKEQEVYIGDIPLMTDNATFVINGVERVIVSQMHRSPGVFFDHDRGKTHASGKYLYSARVIPYRGSWLDFEFDAKDLLFFRIDRKRKILASTLLRALSMTTEEIYGFFYKKIAITRDNKGWSKPFDFDDANPMKISEDLIDAKTGNVIAKSGTRLNKRVIKKLKEDGVERVLISSHQLIGKYLACDLAIRSSKEDKAMEIGDELTEDSVDLIQNSNLKSIEVLNIDHNKVGSYIRNTLRADKVSNEEEALMEIFRILRPGEPTTPEASKDLFESLFFDYARYDLSEVGRVKLNSRLNLDISEETTVLTKNDIKLIVQTLLDIRSGIGEVDDIDNLSNRRIRSVGELVENQFRLGLVRMERTILERISSMDLESVMPNDLINHKTLASVLKEFFGTSQLSQFMDQTNPLSEVTHKRRVSALGPGGLTRDRAGFEVRDVHSTHYGRICPIETPEGQNIGLINSLSSFAKVNKHGFIESPYRKVIDGKVSNEVVYFSAMEEEGKIIAQANSKLNKQNQFEDALVVCRFDGDFVSVEPEQVNYMDVTPMQIISIATALIPFLENDDANRALMGSNMQRQAVPLLSAEAPIVGTGIERIVAADSGSTVTALRDGVVDKVDGTRIVVRYESDSEGSPGVDIYNLLKFQRSNHNTCINQKPLVKVGDNVVKGEVIADGPSTDRGDLALGRNILVAFMPWNGYNFEDSILISEKIVRDDVFTSVHIGEYSVVARDTRLGPEEITRDIPNVAEESLKHLDETGIVHVGAKVKPGDILVGKVTPKSESPMTPEEKLLRAIFGEKAADVKESSLRVPPGTTGVVTEVRVFSRRGIEKDQRALSLERQQLQKLAQDKEDEVGIIEGFVYANLEKLLLKQKVQLFSDKAVKVGDVITNDVLANHYKAKWWKFIIENDEIMKKISALKKKYDDAMAEIDVRYSDKAEKIQSGDNLPQGVLKEVKVFIAMKHKLQPGDKMAGRHGNKGVISKIVPEQDMPYAEDGSAVDMVLNPLGIPSRMNVGQILETHLGWASKSISNKISKMLDDYSSNKDSLRKFLLSVYDDRDEISKSIKEASDHELKSLAEKLSEKGVYFATPVFDGAKVEDVNHALSLGGVCESGQINLIDGRTGEYFDRPVTVGYMYMLKLHHLVDDKIHARSTGPYSLVTQQPLGGKSHFGGQRFGEMECWALEAYGAAYTLQEMLTVKSDDVVGRVKMFESIVRSENSFESAVPESFNVMIKELRSLCLDVELEKK